MILMIIGLIIGVTIGVIITYNDIWKDWYNYPVRAVTGGIIGTLCGFLIALMLPMDIAHRKLSIEIVNLQDNSSISGNFFLGCGQINGEMKYVFYTKSNGLYKMEQIDYDVVQIRYSNGKPKVNITDWYITDSFINNFALDSYLGTNTYIIDVPEGSITNNFKLDAQ